MGGRSGCGRNGSDSVKKRAEKKKKKKKKKISLKNWTNDSIYVIIISGNPLS